VEIKYVDDQHETVFMRKFEAKLKTRASHANSQNWFSSQNDRITFCAGVSVHRSFSVRCMFCTTKCYWINLKVLNMCIVLDNVHTFKFFPDSWPHRSACGPRSRPRPMQLFILCVDRTIVVRTVPWCSGRLLLRDAAARIGMLNLVLC
jgi:hypothetical protein